MATKKSRSDASDATGSGTTILFVDDEPAILEMYELLCGSEHTILTAGSGEAALDQFGDHVDIVFLDRRMPDMSGEALARTIREGDHQPTVGVISAVEPDADVAIEPDVYLTKPVSGDDLGEAIDEFAD